MIGLSTTIFKSAGKKLVNLFGSLASRSTYVENVPDSLSEKNHIDDLGVLDKATILLTPTATSDARVHSVKTYTGDELLDVSSLSGSNWTADGSGGFTNNGLGEGLNGSLNENTIIGATYKFTFDVTISGIANATFGGVTIPVFTTSGSKEYYVTATSSSTSFNFYLATSGSPSMFINNISVVDVSSDFDFDRASSATRINSSGLVQDMQSITDPELVLNGDFSEIDTTNAVSNPTFDLGSDLVTNGDFTTSGIPDTSSYTLGWYSNTDGVEIANGKLTLANDASGAANAYATDGVSSTNILTTNKIYKLTFDITDNTNCSAFQIYQNAGSFVSVTNTVGSYTYYITNTSNSLFLFRNNTVNSSISLDNVSIKEITDWDEVPAGWSFDGNGATHASGNTGILKQYNVTVADNKTWKVQLKVNNVTSGTVIFESGDQESIGYGEGTHEFYHKNTTGNTLGLKPSSDFAGTIEYVNVFEVDPNDRWTVVDSDADNYVEFTEGFARLKFLNTSPITKLETSTQILQANQTYKLVVDVHDVTSGSIKIDGSGMSELFNTEGVTTRYLKPTGNTPLRFYRATADVDITLASVSVKDITFSTDVDLARISYDSNGQNGHILLEPTSTNIIINNNNSFTASRTSITYNNINSPEGIQNAFKVEATTTGGAVYVRTSDITCADTTFSVFVKHGNNQWLQFLSNQSANHYFNFDVQNGVFGTNGTSTSNLKATDFGNGWYRVSGTFTGNTGSCQLRVYLSNASSSGYGGASATSGDFFYSYGWQAEELSYATSYIPTLTGSTVTRATETLTGSGNSTLINSTEGVLYAEISALADDATNRCISLSDGTADDRVTLLFGTSSNRIRAIVKSNGSTSFDEEYTVTSTLDYHKVAIKFKANDFALWIDGVERFSDTSGSAPIGLSELAFDTGISLFNFYGKCKALAVFNEALEDDELELLTGVTNYGSFGELASANGYTII